MSGVETPTPFKDALRAELVAAGERQARTASRRRSSRALAAAAVMAAMLAGGLAFGVGRARLAQADLRVERVGDDVVILLREDDVDPDELEKAAREADIDLTVEEIVASPSEVGRFFGASGRPPPPADFEIYENGLFKGLRLPEAWGGSITVTYGRKAKPGEPYDQSASAMAPGEPLACMPLFGVDGQVAAARIAKALKGKDVRVRWEANPPAPAAPPGPEFAPGQVVILVTTVSATELRVALDTPERAAQQPARLRELPGCD